ncbi:MAG: RidA family protein [Gammaproteobacteria bacterium]|nr:RidA family protein [Gammaproteobacteria bacterium]
MVDYLVSEKLISPKFKYSQLVRAGSHYYCSGLIALDNESGELVNGGIGKETEKILENLQILMSEHELGWKHLAFARVYATDFANFPDFNAVWEALFNAIEVPPPARSSVGVNALPLNAAIEIEFTFYKE